MGRLLESSEEGEDVATKVIEPLGEAFYKPLPSRLRHEWVRWVEGWLTSIRREGRDPSEVAQDMRRASPKYIPREALLVEAYTAAQKKDHSALTALQELFRHPYEEQAFFGERYNGRQ